MVRGSRAVGGNGQVKRAGPPWPIPCPSTPRQPALHARGLTVQAGYDPNPYPKGVKITDAQLAAVPLHRHEWHGEWNHTIVANAQSDLACALRVGLGCNLRAIVGTSVALDRHNRRRGFLVRSGRPELVGDRPVSSIDNHRGACTVVRSRKLCQLARRRSRWLGISSRSASSATCCLASQMAITCAASWRKTWS